MRRVHFHFDVSPPVTEAFVFFCLVLDEKLYDLTDDGSKAPALNTFTRTLELERVALANHAAGIGKDALKPFVEELEWSIARDPALTPQQRALCKVQLDSIGEQANVSEQVSRGVSGLRIVLRDYFASIVAAIRNVIQHEPAKKSDLLELAASFIIQAELEGFPRRHTYHVTQNLLIRALKHERELDPLTLLEKFLGSFEPKERRFDSFFLATAAVSAYPELLKRFGFKTQVEAPPWPGLNKQQRLFIESKRENQTWLAAEDQPARSPVEAHEIATTTFDAMVSVMRFYEHKNDLQLSRLSLTRDRVTEQTYMSHEAPDPMHCWVGSQRATASDLIEIADAIHGGHLRDDSALRLARALRFHKAALQSPAAENQLIDLWAALEGLLPVPKKESLRVEYFSDSLLPALTLTYPEKLFATAFRDTLKVVPATAEVINGLPTTGGNLARFVKLLLCTEYDTQRGDFLNLLSVDPLLRNKLWRLAQLFKSREAVQTALRQHRRKVKWHLARIYFTRNSIMHSASSLPYLSTLVENLHFYLDTLIKAIARVAHASPEVMSIEGALQYLTSWERYRLHAITHEQAPNDVAPKSDEAWTVVFGLDMLLAPAEAADLELG